LPSSREGGKDLVPPPYPWRDAPQISWPRPQTSLRSFGTPVLVPHGPFSSMNDASLGRYGAVAAARRGRSRARERNGPHAAVDAACRPRGAVRGCSAERDDRGLPSRSPRGQRSRPSIGVWPAQLLEAIAL